MNISRTILVTLAAGLLSAACASAASTMPVRPQEVRIVLPKPKSQFEIRLPVPEPVTRIVNLVQGDVSPALCPAPERNEPVCSVSSVDLTQLNNSFDLIWRCDGVRRPCTLFLNGQPVGSVRGVGTAHLPLAGINASYELKDRNNRSCGATFVSGYRGAPPSPAAVAATPTYVQSGYRIFTNADSVTPGSALAALNTAASSWGSSVFRIRMLIQVATADLSVGGENFKLQFATKSGSCGASTYSDVDTSSGLMRYLNNGSVSDGAAISTIAGDPTHGGDTRVAQTYEESNNFTNTSSISAGQDGIWDFPIQNFANGTYCFRAVKSNGTALDSYEQYPEVSCTGEGSC